MFSHYFGNHLLSRKLLTPAQLKDILGSLDSVHVKLGMLAIESRLMTAQQVQEVHSLQMSQDKRFGDIAVERGYISSTNLETLLGKQAKRHQALSQALLDRGMFSFEQLETALADFKLSTNLNEVEIQAIKDNDVDTVVATFFRNFELPLPLNGEPGSPQGQARPERLFQDYVALFVRNLVRFVDPGVVLSPSTCVSEHAFDWSLSQEIEGSIPLFTAITGSGPALVGLGSRFAKMDLTDMDAVGQDAVGEFLNCHNGLFLSKLSNDGVDLELKPPAAHHQHTLVNKNSLGVIPIALPTGSIELVITCGSPAIV